MTTDASPRRRWLTPESSVAPGCVLLVLGAAAWLGTVVVARGMNVMPGTMGLGLLAFVIVWTLMMAAMMLPSVTPFALLYARGVREHRAVRIGSLVGGYLIVWVASGVPAFGLARLGGELAGRRPVVATVASAVIFAACGIYQLTPVKDLCLIRCRSPLGQVFRYGGFSSRAREFRIGMHHGAYCVACCWALMLLLIAFGVMNVAGMVGLAVVVLVEKRSVHGRGFARLVGLAALGLAVAVIWVPGLAPGLHAEPPMASHMAGPM